jgi:hypothetical protein
MPYFLISRRPLRLGLLLLAMSFISRANGDDAPKYATDIQPLLKKNCYSCHGAEKTESGLRLDRKADALAGGDSGKVIVPGDAAASTLIKLVSGKDPDRIMPPNGEKLTAKQIETLKKWIDDGADWPVDDAPSP